MINISILRAMVAAGAPVEAILAAVEADQLAEGERVQARRAKDAERKRRQRHADSAGQCVTPQDSADTLSALTLSFFPSSNSECSQEGSKEVKTVVVEGQKRKKVSRETKKSLLPDDWIPKPAHYAKAKKQNFPDSWIEQKADDLRNWAKSKAIMRADWDATFHGFIRPKELVNGFGGPRPLQDDSKSISRAAGRLAEAAERGDFTFGPIPSLLPQANPNPVLMLPKGRGS